MWPRSIVRRWFVDGVGPGLGAIADVFAQLADHCLELVDAPALLVDHLVELLDHVFLVGQLDFDVDKTVFSTHGMPLAQKLSLCHRARPENRYSPMFANARTAGKFRRNMCLWKLYQPSRPIPPPTRRRPGRLPLRCA
jgi:hypothetical protein